MKKMYLKILMPITVALFVSQNLHAEAASSSLSAPITIVNPSSKIMVERNENGVRSLDMTNPSHYKLVKQRLIQAGRDSDSFPQLHKTLDAQKQQQLKQKSLTGKNNRISSQAVDETKIDIIKNAHFFLDENIAVSEVNNENYLFIRAKSSIYGGTKQTYIDLFLEDGLGNTIAPPGSAFNVLDGKDTLVISAVRLSTLKQQFPNLETIYASSVVELEAADGTISSTMKYTQYPFSWEHIGKLYPQQENKADGDKNAIAVLANPSIGKTIYDATAPVDSNADGVIKVCLNRAHADCDYAADQYLEENEITDVNIPFTGTLRIPHEIEAIYPTDIAGEDRPNGVDEVTNIFLQEGQYGGATKQSYKGLDNLRKNFSDYITKREVTNKDGSRETILSWNIPRDEGRFGNALLFSNINEAHWYISFSVRGWPYFKRSRGPKPINFQVSLTSQTADSFGNYYSPVLPKMQLGYSCLAKGTMITMADGKQRSIEKILAGDMVKGAVASNPATAQPMKVVDISVGVEALQMVRVKGGKNFNLLMTETHPVSTSNKGIVWAQELEEGDRILTEDGTVLITSIDREKYNDNVYNLKLEAMEDANIPEGSYLGMFAGTALVGDLDVQDELNYKDQNIRKTPEEILQRLDEKWKTDYINGLNR